MEFLLKTKEKQSNTIHNELRKYSYRVLFTLLFVALASIGAYSISSVSVSRENNMISLVSNFYANLQKEDRLLHIYASQMNSVTYDELTLQHNTLLSLLNEMDELNVSASYKREVQDLSGILEYYQQKMALIREYKTTAKESNAISQAYYDSRELYEIAHRTFPTVYTELVRACQNSSAATEQNRFVYLFLSLLILFLLIYYMQLQIHQIEQNITLPVQQLENELEQIDLEHLETTKAILCPENSCDDIRLLIRIYNSMLVKIQTQLKEQNEHLKTKLHLQQQKLLNLQMNDELRKSQMANLQAQINPHFLFNTLNMIAQSAYLKNDHHTVSLLETTSDLLRYALDYSDKAVSLQNEILNLGNYVYLQEQRFGSRIRFRFDLDESFHQVLVPNFILQPLVENAIMHGLNMHTEGGEILIRTEYDPANQMGKIRIIDNGKGMDEETLKKVEQQMHSRQLVSGKIGLSNVYLRLSIFFHQNADITLSSIPNKQTEITIHIPCRLEELKKGDTDNV